MGWDLLVGTLRMTAQPSLENTRRFVESVTGPGIVLPEDHVETIHLNAQAVEQGFSGRPKGFYVPPEALADFDGPAVVIVGAHDPMFNPEGTVTAAREGLSGLREAISLPGEGHIFGPDGVEFLRGAAAELFEQLWRYDQVVFDASQSSNSHRQCALSTDGHGRSIPSLRC